ncbi:solute carrier organic anion transporter family member 5A1b [Salminus brasiliensis]|uniref:solute carrier organic anion transporter family member 5A1b n=1 Tax=Salminus brasiliensis TaxID=930266 RepID=UPI003B8396A0
MDAHWLLLCLLALTVAAERRFGCLFEEDLCKNHEICVSDGMFGRCQAMMVADVYTYDITPAILQRFRSLLQKLSLRGLSWKDDVTQQVLSKEFSKLRKISLTPPDTRPMAQAVAVGDGRLKPLEAELNRSLQKYLLHMGLLPKLGSQVSHTKSSEPSEFYRSGKPRNKVDSAPPEFTPESPYQPASYPDLTHYQSDTAYNPSQKQDGSDLLITALKQYLSQNMALKPEQGGRPKLDSVFQKGGSSQSSVKNPLSPVDETFIRNVLRNVGKHNVDVESLSAADLDQLAALIADALQIVEQQAQQGHAPRDLEGEEQPEDLQHGDLQLEDLQPDLLQPDGLQPKGLTNADQHQQLGVILEDQNGSETLKQNEKTSPIIQMFQAGPPVPEKQTKDEERSVTDTKEIGLLGKLLEYLDKTSLSETGPLMKGQGISVETVRSKTTQRDVGVQKKAMEQVEEVEGWVQAAAIAPSSVLEDDATAHRKNMKLQDLQLDVQSNTKNDVYGYIITDTDSLPTDQGLHLMELVAHKAKIQMTDFLELSVVGPAVTFQVRPNSQNVTTTEVASVAVHQKAALEKEASLTIVEAGVTDRSKLSQIPTKYSRSESLKFLILTVISIICIIGVLLVSSIIYCFRHRSHHKLKEKLTNLATDPATEATATYQELCRQRMSVKPPVERVEPRHSSRINSVSSQLSDGPIPSPSARTSTSSWSEEPAHSNMDISTGHMILSYMEDHLKNKNRLEKEWEALCAYQAEPNTCSIGQRDSNAKKNRVSSIIPYDHSRICLKVENSQGSSDYINASPIMDHDPRNPAYIATQGPLPSTVSDFWQMVWESGCVVIVMLTPLTESGVKQCYHYWPDEGSNLYHIYEVNLVSEHVWCEDFLVRSFYLKNMQTNESRTVTQFHYHTWLNQHTPETNQALLDFRRKVNKCYRGRSCPIIVHCSDGAGRTGTYILIDMVLNKMAKGAKEIDIAATLEHLRDQRPGMVQTKEQFEFALTAVAEEVNAILKALPQ